MKDLMNDTDETTWEGATYATLLSHTDSGGAMTILDCTVPALSGPPRHVHAREDETFVLLRGTCEFWLEGQTLHRRAGQTVFVPRGAEHTFRVTGQGSCRHLVILTPGGFEGFFAEMAEGRYAIPVDIGKVVEAGQRYGLTFTGPPLGEG